jgi:hypothetical protein
MPDLVPPEPMEPTGKSVLALGRIFNGVPLMGILWAALCCVLWE